MVRNFANGCNILVHKNALPQGRAFCLGQFLARVLLLMPLPAGLKASSRNSARHLCLGGNCRKQTSRHNAAPCGVCVVRLGVFCKARGIGNQKESTYEALSFSWTCVLCRSSVLSVVVYVARTEQNLSVCTTSFIVRLRQRRAITPDGCGVGFGVLQVLKSARRATYPCRKRPSF